MYGKIVYFVTIWIFAALIYRPSPLCAAERPEDGQINSWVESAINLDPRIMSMNIEIQTLDGIVTLSGKVKSLAARKFARLEAQKINGVAGVIDNLEVEPDYRPDTDISADIMKKFSESEVVARDRLNASVTNGLVTLFGSVTSNVEKVEASNLASQVPGVKSVDNQVLVKFELTRPDDEIADDVLAKINRDVYLAGMPIKVSVRDGNVSLNGSVGNAFQKERAYNDAFLVDNVVDVDNHLEVVWQEEQGVRNAVTAPTDSGLVRSVEAELSQDLRIRDPWEINVSADYGMVTLEGKLPTYHQKKIAEQDTKDVIGVGWVENLITVESEKHSDKAIIDEAVSRLDADVYVDADRIDVKSDGGIVTLTGTLNSTFEKQRVIHDIESIPGIIDIKNDIQIDWLKRYSDREIRQDLVDRLNANWDTSPVMNQIFIAVENGKIILTGVVNRWSQYNEVARIAFQTSGVWSVDNRLEVYGAEQDWKTRENSQARILN
jgi:osmotically-inducible protein OsmY